MTSSYRDCVDVFGWVFLGIVAEGDTRYLTKGVI